MLILMVVEVVRTEKMAVKVVVVVVKVQASAIFQRVSHLIRPFFRWAFCQLEQGVPDMVSLNHLTVPLLLPR